jgi:tetratricopeptide (TPR) repeat protein
MDPFRKGAPTRRAVAKYFSMPGVTLGVVWLLTVAVFWPVRHYRFIQFDDDINIFLNSHLGRWDEATARWILTDIHEVRRYIPAGWAGLSILYGLSGLDPHGYHWACLLLHGVNAVLLAAIAQEVIKRFSSRPAGAAWTGVSAALAAAWWAWHPLRVEPVAWASGYLYIQAIFFLLGSFYLYLTRNDRTWPGRLREWASAGFYLLSVASYPLALAYPAVLLGWEAAVLQRRFRGWPPEGRRAFRTAAVKIVGRFGLIAMLFGSVTLYAAKRGGGTWNRPASLQALTVPARIERVVYAEGYYLWKPWWPFPPRLVPNSVRAPVWREENFGLCLLTLVGMAGACFSAKISRRSGFWAVGASYLVLVLPMSGLFESPYFLSDRYSYLTSLPWAVAVALGLAACARPWLRMAAGLVSAMILGSWLVLSRQRLVAWQDSTAFFNTALSEFSRPDREMEHMYCMIANQLADKGRFEEARSACAQASRMFPNSVEVANLRPSIEWMAQEGARKARGLGLTVPVPELAEGQMAIAVKKFARSEWADAADHLRAALDVMPAYYPARLELAEVLAMQGKPDEALASYLQALAASDGHLAVADRARFLFMLANAAALNGDERLTRVALKKGQALRGNSSH